MGLGYTVIGSDQSESPVIDRLRSLGATVYIGHRAEQISEADVLVVSAAVPADNPERLAAIEPVTERCDAALAEWRAWSDRQPFERAVGSLYRDLEQLVSELEAGECAAPVRSIVRRWLHPHVAAMRDAVTSLSHHPELIEEPV